MLCLKILTYLVYCVEPSVDCLQTLISGLAPPAPSRATVVHPVMAPEQLNTSDVSRYCREYVTLYVPLLNASSASGTTSSLSGS